MKKNAADILVEELVELLDSNPTVEQLTTGMARLLEATQSNSTAFQSVEHDVMTHDRQLKELTDKLEHIETVAQLTHRLVLKYEALNSKES